MRDTPWGTVGVNRCRVPPKGTRISSTLGQKWCASFVGAWAVEERSISCGRLQVEGWANSPERVCLQVVGGSLCVCVWEAGRVSGWISPKYMCMPACLKQRETLSHWRWTNNPLYMARVFPMSGSGGLSPQGSVSQKEFVQWRLNVEQRTSLGCVCVVGLWGICPPQGWIQGGGVQWCNCPPICDSHSI